jgi:ferritin-like metal-binding protein YciE
MDIPGSLMDTKRVKGIMHEAKGAIKESAGKIIGDSKLRARGNAEKNAGKRLQTATKTLDDAFEETLKDLYFAEKQSVKATKKSAKAASLPALKEAFEAHHEETLIQVERLEKVFELLGKSPRAKTCDAMQGIVSEMQEDLAEFAGSPAADAVIIGCAQALEHYEIARYGMMKTWAGLLGMKEAAALFDQSLKEEKNADALLSKLAKQVNWQAA